MRPSISKTGMECSNKKDDGGQPWSEGNQDVGSRTNNPSSYPNSNNLHYVIISNDTNIVDEFNAFVP